MKYLSVIILLSTFVADAEIKATSRVEVSAIAVCATNEEHEGISVEPALRPFVSTLEGCPYNTFHVLMSEQHRILEAGKEAYFTINDRYSLTIKFIEWDENSRIRIHARIREKILIGEKQVVRDALNTTCTLVPQKHLLLGGMKLEEGELALILSVSPKMDANPG